MESIKNITNNPLFKTPMFKYITITVIVIIIVFIVYSYYQGIVKTQKNEPRLIPSKEVQSGKDYFHVLKDDLPSTTHGSGYTVSMWLWINDFEYNYGKYKHVFHKGDFKMNSVQPGIWIHPKTNKLLIRFDNEGRQVNYDKKSNKMFKSLDINKDAHDKMNNVSLSDAEHKCTVTPSCLGFTTIKNNATPNLVEHAYYPITAEDTELIEPTPSYTNKQVDTYTKHTSSYNGKTLGRMNPNNPSVGTDSNISNDIDNIPLNRWFHVIITVTNQTVEVYLDGKLRSTTNSPAPMKNNNGNIYFSAPDGTAASNFDFNEGDGSDSGSGFGGYRTNARFFNRSMKQTEISQMYYKGPSPYMLPDLHNYADKIKNGMKSVTHLVDNVHISGQSFSPSHLKSFL
jgi:hypothetical protein